MKKWLRGLAGLIDVALGSILLVSIVSMSISTSDTAADGADLAWGAIGVIILLAGVGILLHRGWGRVLGTLLALVYVILCSAFFASRGLNFEPGREGFRTWGVIATGVSQVLVLLILLAAWRSTPSPKTD